MQEIINPKLKLKDCVGYEPDPTILHTVWDLMESEWDVKLLKEYYKPWTKEVHPKW